MIAIIYGSTTGNTESAAEKISKALGGADLFPVSDCTAEDLKTYSTLIFGTSTWGIGDVQDDWEENAGLLSEIDYTGKTVGIFGLGDQEGYPDSFVDGMAVLKEKIQEAGGVITGAWPLEGYDFDSSRAAEADSFTGLVLDEDNQPELTAERIGRWTSLFK